MPPNNISYNDLIYNLLHHISFGITGWECGDKFGVILSNSEERTKEIMPTPYKLCLWLVVTCIHLLDDNFFWKITSSFFLYEYFFEKLSFFSVCLQPKMSINTFFCVWSHKKSTILLVILNNYINQKFHFISWINIKKLTN